jgi:hypothetical protein
MRTAKWLMIASILALINAEAFAQGVITWEKVEDNYPFTSKTKVASITIKGSVSLDKDWKINKIHYHVWRNGKAIGTAILPMTSAYKWPAVGGNWVAGNIQDLSFPDTEFNVVVFAELENTNTKQVVVIATQPVLVKTSKNPLP